VEVDIVEDLLDSNEFGRVRSAMIDPSVAHRERELRERLGASGLTNYFMEDELMVGATHRARIQNWLRVAGAEERSPATAARRSRTRSARRRAGAASRSARA
jgi:hypothetical protein